MYIFSKKIAKQEIGKIKYQYLKSNPQYCWSTKFHYFVPKSTDENVKTWI